MTCEGAPSAGGHKKDIFLTGEYVQHFTPDDKRNPFCEIYRQKKRDAVDIICKLGRPGRILDVGGGMGRLSLELAGSLRNRIILADISVDMLELAVKGSGEPNNIEVVNADAHDLPFADNSFDVVVGLDLLCHLERPDAVLGEFRRLLSDGGVLLMDSTNSNPLWALFYPRYMGKNPLNWIKIMRYKGILPGWENIVKHYPKQKFISLLRDAGFEVMQEIDYGPFVCPKWHLAVSRKG